MGEDEIIAITFTAEGPISSGVLNEEMAEALRQLRANRDCEVYWGSHGCDLKRHHEGWHTCQDEDEAEPHSTVSPEGIDESGFEWHLYGADAP